jgi:hypothetical protein
MKGLREGLLPAGLLLLLVLLLDARAWQTGHEPGSAKAGPPVTPIRVFSTAAGLEPASLGGSPVPDAILIDDLYLRSHPEASGVRVATLSPEREIRGYRNFDVRSSDGAVGALLAHVERQPHGSVLVLTARGAIRPAGEGAPLRGEALRELMRELGAQSNPFDAPRASWSLIALRRPRGWVPLAEAYAEQRPTRLAFSVATDTARYDDWRADLVADRNVERRFRDAR